MITLLASNHSKSALEKRFISVVNFTKGENFLVYSNSEEAYRDLRKKVQDILRASKFRGHLVLLTGEPFVKEKRCRVAAVGDPDIGYVMLFGMIISSDVVTVGFDLPSFMFVYCNEIPPLLLSLY